MRAVVLHDAVPDGARADELDTLVQVDAVRGALRELGHEVHVEPFGLDLQSARRNLEELRPDFVFNLVESVDRRGSLIHLAPALLEAIGIPFTGASAQAMFLTSGKPLAKRLMAGAGIATPAWLTEDELGRDGGVEPGRWIVKSAWEHASIGLEESSVVEARSCDELARALDSRRAQLMGEGFVERFVDGREFNVGLLQGPRGVEALPLAEIEFRGWAPGRPRVVGWSAKWDEPSEAYCSTVRSYDFPACDASLLAELSGVSMACWRAFGMRGYARVDLRVDEEGRPFVLEVNANPCLTPDAGFCAAAARAGLSLNQIVERIVAASFAAAPR